MVEVVIRAVEVLLVAHAATTGECSGRYGGEWGAIAIAIAMVICPRPMFLLPLTTNWVRRICKKNGSSQKLVDSTPFTLQSISRVSTKILIWTVAAHKALQPKNHLGWRRKMKRVTTMILKQYIQGHNWWLLPVLLMSIPTLSVIYVLCSSVTIHRCWMSYEEGIFRDIGWMIYKYCIPRSSGMASVTYQFCQLLFNHFLIISQ